MRTFVIAEAGVNHNGSLELALRLVDAAAAAGADAVKFQTFRADDLVARNTETVAYQAQTTGLIDQHELIRRLELSHDAHRRLLEHAASSNVEFMSTAFDPGSAEFLIELGIKRVKVPSGEITNLPFLEQLARYGLPMILSTGMSDLAEVKAAAHVIQNVQASLGPLPHEPALCVLHCTTAYPTSDCDANLAAIRTLRDELNVAIGYSDHTSGTLAAPIAVAMGACVIEKHITLDRSLPGPDHAASIEPGELAQMIANIRRVEAFIGDGIKVPRPAALEARQLVRKGLKAARDLPENYVLVASDISVLRPAEGLSPVAFKDVIGRRTKVAIVAGAPLTWDVIS